VLPKVKVLGKAGSEETNPKEIGYNAIQSSTAMKMELPLQQLPFSVKVVTKELIKDQNAITLERALENSNAIASDANSGFGAKTYTVRGFDLSNRLLVNGVRAIDYAETDPAMIERIEVLKGAAANLYGRTEPGGLINIVTVKPKEDFAISGSQGFGSYDLYRTTFDVTGAATEDKSLLYRLTVANTNSNSYRDTVVNNRLSISPALIIRPTAMDEIFLRYERKDFRYTTDNGQPLKVLSNDPGTGNPSALGVYGFARSTVVGGYNNFNNLAEDNYLSKWTHEFDREWKLNTTLNYYNYVQNGLDASFNNGSPVNNYQLYVGNPSNFTGQGEHLETDLVGKFATWGIRHNSLLTFEYINRLSTYHEWACNNTSYFLNLYNPVYQNVQNITCGYPANLSSAFGYNNRNQWLAWSAQDMINLTEKLRIMLGYRMDYAYASSASFGHNFGSAYDNRLQENSPLQGRYGISYDLVPNVTWFASFSQGFGTANMGNPLYNGQAAKAETSEQKEIGFKTQWFENKLSAEVAYFDLRKQNYLLNVAASSLGKGVCTTFAALGTCNIQAGEIGGQGIEFNASGEVYENWSLNLAYTNMDPRYLKGDPSGVSNPTGQRVAGVPRDSGSTWLSYKDPDNWFAGLGATYIGERPLDAPTYQMNTTYMMPAWVRWDLSTGYTYKINQTKITAQLNINNIFNANTLQKAYSLGSGVLPGQPTTAYGSIKVEF